ALLGSLITRLREKLTDEPHLVGLAPEELRGLLPRSRRGSPSEFNHLLELAVETNALMPAGGKFTLPGRQIAVSGQIKEEARRILLELNSSPFAPPLIPKLVDSGKNAREALGYLFNTDQAVKISSELALSVGAWNDTLAGICERLLAGGELNVAWLRTRLNTSRKYALPLLEETDRRGITTRDGDLRVKGPQFEKTVAELNPTGA
ncbi:MAG: SelB C-terminal domain-containing protein, partial [Candidatus Zixiibacteriota bacterium]